jgi:type IV secretion system protein VirB3
MENEEDYSATIHQAVTRPLLMMGSEREFIMFLGVIAGTFILVLASLWSFIFGIVLFIGGSFALRRSGSYDPQFSKTAIRHFRYKKFYGCGSKPFAENKTVEYKKR